jgi:hypothetical protein
MNIQSEDNFNFCPKCNGSKKEWVVDIQNLETACRQILIDCTMCQGTGVVGNDEQGAGKWVFISSNTVDRYVSEYIESWKNRKYQPVVIGSPFPDKYFVLSGDILQLRDDFYSDDFPEMYLPAGSELKVEGDDNVYYDMFWTAPDRVVVENGDNPIYSNNTAKNHWQVSISACIPKSRYSESKYFFDDRKENYE